MKIYTFGENRSETILVNWKKAGDDLKIGWLKHINYS